MTFEIIPKLHFIDFFVTFINRGRKGIEMYPSYEKTVKSLAAFAEVAGRSAEIPIATSD